MLSVWEGQWRKLVEKIFECRSKSKKLNDGFAGLDEHEQNEIIPKTKINVLSGILNISFHLFT